MTDDIFKYIDVERTIAEFGYDPRDLTYGSKRKVIGACKVCKIEKIKSFRNHIQNPKCISCSLKGRPVSEESRKKRSQSLKGRIFSPETRIKMSEAQKGKKASELTKTKMSESRKKENLSLETRKRLSDSHKGEKHHLFGRKHKPESILKMSLSRKGKNMGVNSPRYGKPAAHGKGSWYVKKDGNKVWMRSTWEFKYAKHLDDIGISWEVESKPFPVTYEYKGEIKEGNYWPDFLVNGEWFEIKAYWRDDAKPKFEAFKAQYPDERITLLMKPELLALGIEL